jgi:DNA-binding transcriptional MerR regulator
LTGVTGRNTVTMKDRSSQYRRQASRVRDRATAIRATHIPRGVPVADMPPAAPEERASQGSLFENIRNTPDDAVGYRGPTAYAAAGITYRQLDYWARTDLVVPSVRGASGSGSQRLYSFKDILVLKIVKKLLDAGVSLQNVRVAVEHLRLRGVEDLAEVTLFSDGVTVYECTSAEEVIDLLRGGQGVFGIAVSGALRELTGSLAHLPSERAAPATALELGAETADQDELSARRAKRSRTA